MWTDPGGIRVPGRDRTYLVGLYTYHRNRQCGWCVQRKTLRTGSETTDTYHQFEGQEPVTTYREVTDQQDHQMEGRRIAYPPKTKR